MKVTKKQILKWTQALRSGRYQQAKSTLQADISHYCCLGVACRLFIPAMGLDLKSEGMIFGGYPSAQPNAPDWLKKIDKDFSEKTGVNLSSLNDNGTTFDEIADLLELVYVHKIL